MIHFEQIKTNRKFREINSGFSDSGIGVRSYEQDISYLYCYCFFFVKTFWLVKKIREKFMALSKSTFSVKMRGEIQRELPFIRKLNKFYFEGKRQAATSRLLADWGESHNGCFWDFLSKKYLRQISILGTKDMKIWKSKGTFVMLILKVIYLTALFFQISYSYSSVPKIEICLK